MASSRDSIIGMYIVLFILIFSFPVLNTEVHTIGEDVGATSLEIAIMTLFPTIHIAFVIAFASLCIVKTVGMIG